MNSETIEIKKIKKTINILFRWMKFGIAIKL